MEDEVKRAPPKYRTPMLTRIRSYKQDLQDIEKQLVSCKQDLKDNRETVGKF